MKIKNVIFDVDGVILNTVPYHFKAWKKLFAEQGLNFTFEDYILKVNGLPRMTGIKNIIKGTSNISLQDLADKKQKYLKEMFAKSPPKILPGVIYFLKKLAKNGLNSLAASSSKNAPLLLAMSKLDSYFLSIISGYDFSKPKPDPEIFITACNKAKSAPQECLVIEDSSLGIQAAKNAGMKTIGLLTSNDNNIKKIADFTIDSLKEYMQVLEFIKIIK